MPVYEYRCQACGKRFSRLIGMTAEPDSHACPHCGASGADRLVSRFGRGRSEDDRIEEIVDRMDQYGDPESASQAQRMAREIGKALDEDAGDEMERMFEGEEPP